MGKKNRKWFVGVAIVVFGVLLVWDILYSDGPEDLKGGFEEIAFVRNEQNKGGIIRIYAFGVSDTIDADYVGCGNLLPHNDYGSTTTAYFFDAAKPFPDKLRLEPPHFDTVQYRPVAVYVKDKGGAVSVSGSR